MYTLFDYYRSSASYRVRLVLNYKNIAYDKHEVHLVNNGGEHHSNEYKKINSQELVPTLSFKDVSQDSIRDDSKEINLSQSLAIIEYLEEQHPEPSILPTDILLRAEARKLAYLISCDVHPLNNLRVLKYLQENLSVTEQEKTNWYHHWLKLGFTAYEQSISNRECRRNYSIGETFSIADACLIPQVYNALRFELPMTDYPIIMEIYENCLSLNFVQRAEP